MNVVKEYGLDRSNFVWQHLALCAGMDTNIFYDYADSDKIVEREAKAVCAVCPVRDMAKDRAEENKETGIWGGETFKDGRAIN